MQQPTEAVGGSTMQGRSLERFEQRFRALFESSLDAVLLTRADGSIEAANPTACAMFGMTEAEICRAGRAGIVDQADGRLAGLAEARRRDGRVRGHLTFVRKDGSRIEGDFSSVVLDDAGQAFVIIRDVTERQGMERALRQSEVKFAAAFRTGPVAKTIIDLSDGHVILESNQAFARLTGYRADEVRGQTLAGTGLWLDEDAYEQVFQRLKESGSVPAFELQFRRKDGTVRTGLHSVDVIEIEGRLCALTTTVDITERKQTEQQVKRLNRLYAVLSRCNAAGAEITQEPELLQAFCDIAAAEGGFRIAWVGRVDLETGWVTPVARAGEAASYLDEVRISAGLGPYGLGPTGISIRERRAVASTDFSLDESMGPWREAAERCGLRSSVSVPLIRRGEVTNILGLYSGELAFFDRTELALAEEIGSSLSIALDRIDLRKERERAESERELIRERLELALDAASEGYLDWKVDTDEWYLSPRYHEILGYKHGEVEISREFLATLVHPEDRQVIESGYLGLVRGQVKGNTFEFRIRHRDGHYIWISASSKVAAYDASGRPSRIVGTRSDVTHRKLLEQQFLQSQKMESVGRLAGGIAHDFNNLLTIINGYSSLILAQIRPDDPIRRSVGEIQKSGERAAALTRQLLAFSRKQILQPRTLNLNDTIQAMRSMLNRWMGEDIAVEVFLSEQPVMVYADPHQLEQVIMNLAVNSRDAMPGGGRLRIETRLVDLDQHALAMQPGMEAGQYAMLAVGDSGSGMDEATMQRIFEPFFTTKQRGQGTGLGLSMVQGVVTQSGGFITVDSTPERGTEFRIYLPSQIRTDLPLEALTGSLDPARLDRAAGRETVLVVEDQAEVRAYVTSALERFGYRVLQASGAGDASEICASTTAPIHLLLTDVVMPGMSGPMLAQQLSRTRKDMRILFMSGYSPDMIIRKGLTEEGVQLIQKPFNPEQLAEKVRYVLDLETGSSAAGASHI